MTIFSDFPQSVSDMQLLQQIMLAVAHSKPGSITRPLDEREKQSLEAIAHRLQQAIERCNAIVGTPYRTTITIHDGEHEHSDSIMFLVPEGGDPDQYAQAIACNFLNGDDDEGNTIRTGKPWSDRYEFEGDYRQTEVEWVSGISLHEYDPDYDQTPSEEALEWYRSVAAKSEDSAV